MTFIDTNVIIDIFERDAVWFGWSAEALSNAVNDGAVIDPVVVAELSRNFAGVDVLLCTIDALQLAVVPLDTGSAFLAGKRFQAFREGRYDEENKRVLPDFFIGAHAATLGLPLLTRDPRFYRRYFPELTIITPETHP